MEECPKKMASDMEALQQENEELKKINAEFREGAKPSRTEWMEEESQMLAGYCPKTKNARG